VSLAVSSKQRRSTAAQSLRQVVRWYVELRQKSDGELPFYCRQEMVGHFAVEPEALAQGEDEALFRLFVGLSMFQALRDVVIMRQQRAAPAKAVRRVADLPALKRAVAGQRCRVVRSSEFEKLCDVSKHEGAVDCTTRPGARCHVKDSTVVFNRMSDMGKLPTAALLRVWRKGGTREVLRAVCATESSPTRRAGLLVARFAEVHRVGEKLATMFVSALSTPVIAPGLSPWFPLVDGNDLVVVDTNVARAVDALREPTAPRTYQARADWLRARAAELDLKEFSPTLPRTSARFVQEALYKYCSSSNRRAAGDPCAKRADRCAPCVATLCPFGSEKGVALGLSR
jgi:hypothetical protein